MSGPEAIHQQAAGTHTSNFQTEDRNTEITLEIHNKAQACIWPTVHCDGAVRIYPSKTKCLHVSKSWHFSTTPLHLSSQVNLPGKTISVADLTNYTWPNFYTQHRLRWTEATLSSPTSQGDLQWGQHTGVLPLTENTRQHIGAVNPPWMGNLTESWGSTQRVGEW